MQYQEVIHAGSREVNSPVPQCFEAWLHSGKPHTHFLHHCFPKYKLFIKINKCRRIRLLFPEISYSLILHNGVFIKHMCPVLGQHKVCLVHKCFIKAAAHNLLV